MGGNNPVQHNQERKGGSVHSEPVRHAGIDTCITTTGAFVRAVGVLYRVVQSSQKYVNATASIFESHPLTLYV